MKIVFFGSDEFAATNLGELITKGHEIVGVVTPPDRPRDRLKVTFLPVKMIALEHLIEVFQPEDLTEQTVQQKLKSLNADLFVVIAYGQFLPKEILNIPKYGCVNVHASILPQYRGAAPINWAIIHGEMRTGVTVIQMNEQMDAGDILGHRSIDIAEDADAQVLREKLASLGASCLIDVVDAIKNQTAAPIPQDNNAVTYARKLSKNLGQIDWRKDAWEIHNLIRGLVPWPSAYTFLEGKRLKILESAVYLENDDAHQPGTVIELVRNGIVVACGKGQLLLKRVQPESSKPMDARSFSLGHRVQAGSHFQL